MSVSIEVVQPNLYAGAVADEIIESAKDAMEQNGSFSLALSGGRTPGAVYRALTNSSRADQIEWQRVSLYLGDERWVPQTDQSSNARMVRETLLDPLGVDVQRFCYVDTALPTVEAAVKNYSEELRTNLPLVDGTPTLDLVLLGLGEDGHIASLFPQSSALLDQDSLVVSTINPEDQSQRVSLAPRVILAAKKILFIVRGESKRRVLRSVLSDRQADVSKLPAMMLHAVSEKVTWYLDSAAAAELGPDILGK